ncbi:TATA box-binding protein-associated factor RNA polymerase I subunit D [Saccopteryx leptura]|uniref:TATA box-binding protein-associated factor RNA polymerase I subunit D n=1 Tax=Saccopteryx leptura TaxID=249018 RepID=UPI00339CAB8C
MDSVDYIAASDSAMEMENHSDNSSSGSSLFKTQCVPYSPQQRQRNPIRKLVHSLSERVQATDSSSDSSIEPRPLTLKAIFERFKKKKRKKKKYKRTGRPQGRPKGSKNTRLHISKKQFKDRRPQLPFLESEYGKKPLPWKKMLNFEQAVARGFFNYLEKLKYEYHLKESLKQMNVGEDLEKEDLDSRRYKFLDDDGSISPIEESAEDEVAANLEHSDECDIRLVESNYFIISSEFPKKMNVYLEAAPSKKASKFKNMGPKAEWPEKKMGI